MAKIPKDIAERIAYVNQMCTDLYCIQPRTPREELHLMVYREEAYALDCLSTAIRRKKGIQIEWEAYNLRIIGNANMLLLCDGIYTS